MAMTTRFRPLMAMTFILAVGLAPPAVAQLETVPLPPPGGGPITFQETQTECEVRVIQDSIVEVCPSQTGSSTRNQFFNFVSNLGTRISQQRRVVRDTDEESEDESETAFFGPVLGGAASADDDGGITEYGRLSAFGIADYSESDRDSTSSGQSYDQETESAILGVDYRFSNTLFAGVTLNYLSGDTDFDGPEGSLGSTDVDSYVLGVHASKYSGNGYMEALLTYGQFDLGIERIEGSGFLQTRYGASPDGDLGSVDVALGYVHSSDRWRFNPVFKFLYMDGSIDGYSEEVSSGLGSPKTFRKQDFSAINVELSLQTDYVILTGWGVLIPSLKVAYHRELDDRHTVRGTRFGQPFAQETDDLDRNTLVARLGVSAQFQRGWSAFASYEKLFEHRYLDRDNAVVGVRYEFF